MFFFFVQLPPGIKLENLSTWPSFLVSFLFLEFRQNLTKTVSKTVDAELVSRYLFKIGFLRWKFKSYDLTWNFCSEPYVTKRNNEVTIFFTNSSYASGFCSKSFLKKNQINNLNLHVNEDEYIFFGITFSKIRKDATLFW